MPCPLFLPSTARCSASPEETLDARLLETGCRRGYARVLCGRAATHRADAVRFLVKSDRDGVVEIAWSMERDHLPVGVGLTRGLYPDTGDETLNLQLRGCAEEWSKEKKKRL